MNKEDNNNKGKEVILSNQSATSNNKSEQDNFQQNSSKGVKGSSKMQHLEQKPQNSSRKLMNYGDRNSENPELLDYEFSDESYDSNNEDDEERYIKKESHLQEINEEIMQDIISDLDECSKGLDGIRPNTSHNRSLSHEHGGLEKKTITHDKGGESIYKDEWDDQSEDLSQDVKEEDDRLNDIDESSLRQSFIHTSKQKKKKGKKGKRGRRGKSEDEIEESMDDGRRLNLLEARTDNKASFVDRVNQNKENSRGGGGIQII